MAYRKIDAKFKLEVIKNYWAISNISQTSKKYGVGRDAIYAWLNIAEKIILEHFANLTTGKRVINLVEENRKLREQVIELSDVYQRLLRKLGKRSFLPEGVLNCQRCGSENVWKNGKVYTKTYGLQQRISCQACSFSVYVELKKLCRSSD